MEAGIHELTAGYALDALDADERAAYEAHLAGCEQCQSELESFWPTTEALAVAASGPAPSDGLRDRILAEARAEPQSSCRSSRAAAGSCPCSRQPPQSQRSSRSRSGSGPHISRVSSTTRARRSTASVRTPRCSSTPRAARSPSRPGTGKLVVDPEGRSVLVLDGLGPAPAGKTYELWIMPDGNVDEAARAGLFPGRDGANVVGVDGTVQSGDVVGVTVESAGGVDAPTSAPIVASQPA